MHPTAYNSWSLCTINQDRYNIHDLGIVGDSYGKYNSI